MSWSSTAPDGNQSVKANEAILQGNTNYIQTTMGNSVVGTNTTSTRDHFWNVGGDEDGRHRFINSPAFTVGGNPTDPVVGTGMDAVLYLKTTNDIPQWFTRTSVVSGGIIYQVSPTFLSGTFDVTSSYQNLVAVPANVYGEIAMYFNDLTGLSTSEIERSGVRGHFRSNNTRVLAWSFSNTIEDSDTNVPIKFRSNSGANDLNIKVRTSSGKTGTWLYRITYRAL